MCKTTLRAIKKNTVPSHQMVENGSLPWVIVIPKKFASRSSQKKVAQGWWPAGCPMANLQPGTRPGSSGSTSAPLLPPGEDER